jgi:D-alanyl-D-alanine carboxypeptidase
MAIAKVVGGPKETKKSKSASKKVTKKGAQKSAKQFHQKKRDQLGGHTWEWLAVVTVGIVALGMTVLVATNWWQRSSLPVESSGGKTAWQSLGLIKNGLAVSPTPALPPPAMIPEFIQEQEIDELELTAESYLAIDVDSMVVLTEKNKSKPWPPASITKVMTAVVALESYPLEAIVTVEPVIVEGRKMDLVTGEKISVKNLIFGLLVESGNDAAEALASFFPGGRGPFIEAMNFKAKQWHLVDTRFTNPSGVDDDYHFSTPLDIARMTAMALRDEEFTKMIVTEKMVVESVDQSVTHHLTNTNELLNKVEGVKGVKTGWTEESGESLVTLTERGRHRVVTVILGSKDRFGESERLIEWVFGNVEWREVGN